MKNLTAILTILICAIGFTQATAQIAPDTARTYWTSGVRLNQGHLVGMVGVTRQVSSRIFLYGGADLGGPQYAAYTQSLVRITKPGRFTLFAVIGPQIERVETNPTKEQLTTYLTAATGAVAAYDFKPDVSAWAGVTYLITGADIKQWKVGAGLSLPLDL